jgi:hypothetical protein
MARECTRRLFSQCATVAPAGAAGTGAESAARRTLERELAPVLLADAGDDREAEALGDGVQ